jgi:hypothetical protein
MCYDRNDSCLYYKTSGVYYKFYDHNDSGQHYKTKIYDPGKG